MLVYSLTRSLAVLGTLVHSDSEQQQKDVGHPPGCQQKEVVADMMTLEFLKVKMDIVMKNGIAHLMSVFAQHLS